MTELLMYSPRPNAFAKPKAEAQVPAALSRNLVGATVGIVDDGLLLDIGVMLEQELRRLGAGDVQWFRAPSYTDLASTEFLDDIAAKVAGAVTGLGS
ncbi:hypothetical protein [Cellulosimicrobium sp. KWT-B]|uniref:hypothetical protein n=1 Tax=Cellulosimicrobium sp. KWT-B TaxID=1981152 RepID=UPI000A32422E|nr:hypothetical protein [Cellulosimicrobium sp. KWT-B]